MRALIGQLVIYHLPVDAREEKNAPWASAVKSSQIKQIPPVSLKCTAMKWTNVKWKLKKIFSSRFEEKSEDQACPRSKNKFAQEEFITVFLAAKSSKEKPSEQSVFEDLSPRFKVNFVCFYERESLFWNENLSLIAKEQRFAPLNLFRNVIKYSNWWKIDWT